MPDEDSLAPGGVFHGRSLRAVAITLAIASALIAFGIALRAGAGGDPVLLRREATTAAQQGRWADAEASLGHLTDPTPADWLLRAVVATSLDRPDAAAAYLAKVPPDGPLAARVALVASRVELGRSRARPMEASLQRALRLDPRLAEARRSLVYLYGVQGRRPELLEQFAAIAEQGPLTFELVDHWCIARQEQVKEPDDLKPALERFVASDPGDRWSRLNLSRVYRRLGLFERSVECLAPLPDSDPEARACRAEVAFDQGDLDAVARLLAEGPPDHPKLARLRGQVALGRHDGPSAVRFFRLSEEAEPDHGETLYGLAQALRVVGDRAAAEPYARRAEAQRVLRGLLVNLADNRDPKPVLCRRLASDCEAAGYLPEARAWYRLAIADDPLNEQAQQALFRLSSTPSGAEGSGRPTAGRDEPGRSEKAGRPPKPRE